MPPRAPLIARLRLGACAALLALASAGRAAASEAAPPSTEYEFDGSAAGGCKLDGGGSIGGTQSLELSALARRELPARGWYGEAGLRAENYSLHGVGGRRGRLRDYAAVLGVACYQGKENVAELTFRPGWYFGNHPSKEALDAPVDCTCGFPLRGKLSGVTGFSNARFYHHAVPVAGLVWAPDSPWRVELVFPEPAVVVNLGSDRSLRIGGRLMGGGFLSDSRTRRSVVEYDSYRVGAELTLPAPYACLWTVGAGVETERSFDFFRQGRRTHGGGAGYLELGLSGPR